MSQSEVQEVSYKFFHEHRGRLLRIVHRDESETKSVTGFLSHIRHGHVVLQDVTDTIPIRRIDAVYNIVNQLVAGKEPHTE